MPRLLRYVSGVRLVADPYDLRLWHFTISGKRYNLQAARGGSFLLQADDGTALGRFQDWSQAVACANERAHDSATERLPIISPYTRASLAR
jgi:hypothetical protein